MAAEKQVPGGGGGGGGSGSGGSGGGRGAGGEENKENERPSAGSKANKEFGDSLSLEILQIIKESQQQHGLRHGDFQRYRYLLLVLMDAERAWSYAMQLKQEANTEPRKRFHLLSRLRKAVKHAEELERLCESNRVDAKTKLEAQAYTAYLSGMLRFEHQEWKAAIEAFNKCKTIYEKLASAFTEEQAVLYNQRVEEISPNIRYCAYNIGDQSAINELMQMRLRSGGTEGLLAEKLEALITQTRAKQAATMSEVEWRGRTVPVKIDKVRIFLLGLADNEAAIVQAESEETKERLFESMLSECRDAIQVVREELKPDQKQRDYILEGESGKVSNLQYLHSYLTYIKLSTAIKRNENMAKGLQRALLQQQPEDDSKRSPRPQDLIRLYDIILQNLVELLQLPGLEEDKAFQKEIGLKTLVFKAYRCFFIAQSYVLVKKWSEALVLYDRVLKYANEVNSDAGAFKNSLKDLPDVQELITQVRSEKCSLQAAAILDGNDAHQTETSSSQVKDNKPLVERFETFCLDPSLVTKQANLVHFPPGFQPIPCKPLFFDLALNHVAFPPLEDKLEQKTKSGLTGYIKGIFGFRS
ncbi:signal recognition particle subunit SRP68 isoform X3 [Macaca mulatta]|uniref:Signal recognition particle subunit SRP68 n=4 Tax=Cercopithecinae TaxID=9528 RepID=A0A2K5NHT9_CERAT|nr:PREDICTED: signal recognition particle subunit SRP68 isoform X3 [Mandrillus leucophaeus]XP_025219544.1 signal recognition particle subunit SRP68 isoform X3 [Theropithecus gelada]